MPNGQDLATQIRSRLENTGGLSVQLRPGDLNADLNLVDRKAWTSTALAWLQPYLDAPLPAADSTVSTHRERIPRDHRRCHRRPVAGRCCRSRRPSI